MCFKIFFQLLFETVQLLLLNDYQIKVLIYVVASGFLNVSSFNEKMIYLNNSYQ